MAKENPLIDTSNVTVNAFNAIKSKEKKGKNITLGKTDTTPWTSPNFKVKVKAWTSTDKKTHTYFHSLSIDVNVEDFMGTAELKCPYDSDLMKYWEPIRQTVVIYGANRGDYKILFIGRVRGVKQDGYELVIEFQNYGWKFKQLVTQSYANDNVINKDGFTIMRLMFEALKIDSYVISTSAKNRLKEVGVDSDGNVTMNGKELEKMPDLLKRLQKSDPSKLVNKSSLNNKLREKYLHNIKNINYTLKYEKPTKVMKKIASQGHYSGGNPIYENVYGGGGGTDGSGGVGAGGGAGSAGASGSGGGCTPGEVTSWGSSCSGVPSSLHTPLKRIWMFNGACGVNDYTAAKQAVVNFARNYANTYFSAGVSSCLGVLAQRNRRSDGHNAASETKSMADWEAGKTQGSRVVEHAVSAASSFGNAISNTSHAIMNRITTGLNQAGQAIHNFVSNPIGTLKSWFGG